MKQGLQKYEKVIEGGEEYIVFGFFALFLTLFFSGIYYFIDEYPSIEKFAPAITAGMFLGFFLMCLIKYYNKRKVYWRKIK